MNLLYLSTSAVKQADAAVTKSLVEQIAVKQRRERDNSYKVAWSRPRTQLNLRRRLTNQRQRKSRQRRAEPTLDEAERNQSRKNSTDNNPGGGHTEMDPLYKDAN